MTGSTARLQASGQTYRAEIDGLRAIAVLAVLFYHAHIPGFGGGFVGVDVFFVISGYLITRIIRRETLEDSFSIARFYERRARRILPALCVMLAASALAASFLLLPGDLRLFSQSLIATALFGSNIFFWQSMDYFSQPAELMPLLHTWSLAIEEQFYILFPLLMLLLARRGGEWTRSIIGLLTLGSLLLAMIASGSPVASFFLAPMRAWELGVGALLAVGALPRIQSAAWRQSLALVSLAALLWSFVIFDPQGRFPWPWALLPTIATAAFLLANDGARTWAGKALSLTPIVGLGLISYSLYLWHWPLFAFARYAAGPLTMVQTATLLAASLPLAFLSLRYVEQPFRGRDAQLTRAGIFKAGAAALVLLSGLGAAGFALGGLPGRFPERVWAMEAHLHTDVVGLYRANSCFLRQDQNAAAYDDRLCRTHAGKPVALLWGDSHAAHLWPGLAATPSLDVLQATYTGCPPVLDTDVRNLPGCRAFNDHIRRLVEQEKIGLVILSAHWLLDRAPDAALMRTIDWLRALRIPVILAGPNVEFDTPLPHLLARQIIYGDGTPAQYQPVMAQALTRDDQMRARYGNLAGVRYASILQGLCDGATCLALLPGETPINWDESHLTAAGSRLVAQRILLPAIAASSR